MDLDESVNQESPLLEVIRSMRFVPIILFVIYVKSSGRRVTISFITSEAFEETTDYLRK